MFALFETGDLVPSRDYALFPENGVFSIVQILHSTMQCIQYHKIETTIVVKWGANDFLVLYDHLHQLWTHNWSPFETKTMNGFKL